MLRKRIRRVVGVGRASSVVSVLLLMLLLVLARACGARLAVERTRIAPCCWLPVARGMLLRIVLAVTSVVPSRSGRRGSRCRGRRHAGVEAVALMTIRGVLLLMLLRVMLLLWLMLLLMLLLLVLYLLRLLLLVMVRHLLLIVLLRMVLWLLLLMVLLRMLLPIGLGCLLPPCIATSGGGRMVSPHGRGSGHRPVLARTRRLSLLALRCTSINRQILPLLPLPSTRGAHHLRGRRGGRTALTG